MSAYRYVLKEDEEPYHSPGHPNLDLASSLRTSKDSRSHSRRRNTSVASSSKRKRLSKADVMDIKKFRNISNETEFLALAVSQAENGDNDLKTFENTPERVYRELISKTWKLENAPNDLHRKSLNRIDSLKLL